MVKNFHSTAGKTQSKCSATKPYSNNFKHDWKTVMLCTFQLRVISMQKKSLHEPCKLKVIKRAVQKPYHYAPYPVGCVAVYL